MKLKFDYKDFEAQFVRTFKHAGATQQHAKSVLLRLSDEENNFGYGEGCPRQYVTRESQDSVHAFLNELDERLCNFDQYSKVSSEAKIHWETPGSQAAWCTFELAWLDLFSIRAGKTIDQYLGFLPATKTFKYSAVLGVESLPSFQKSVAIYNALEFTDFKLKLEGNFETDNARICILRDTIGSKLHLRLDGNNCFKSSQEAIREISKLAITPWAVEEPIQPKDFAGLIEVANKLNTKVILDESCSTKTDLEWSLLRPQNFIVNLRISKFGGLINAIECCRQAARAGLGLILGCHVGESSISTRAALVIANAFPEIIMAQEGAFGTALLSSDVVTNPIMFSKGGLLSNHPSFTLPGFGLEVQW